MEGLRKTVKTSARITDVVTKIRTQHLPNTRRECYCYTNPFCEAAVESVKFVKVKQQFPIFLWMKG
jgi:hypothetical protein